jgi:hypothetical protein
MRRKSPLFSNSREGRATDAIQEDPSSPEPYRTLAACYAHMGRIQEAREVVTQLRAIASVPISDPSRFRNPEHREVYISGLRLAASQAT